MRSRLVPVEGLCGSAACLGDAGLSVAGGRSNTRVYCIALIRVLMPAVSCTVRVSKKCAIAARRWRSEADGVLYKNTDLQMVAQPSYPSSLKRSTRRR